MPELDEIRRRLAEVDAELAAAGRAERAEEHRLAIEQLRSRFEHRFESLARAHEAAASLQTLSSQHELLRRAPQTLASRTEFRRAIIGTIADGVLTPVAAHFELGDRDADADAAEQTVAQLSAQPLRLEHHMAEADVIRRRRAMIVGNVGLNPRVDRRMATLLGWSSYVAAPLVSGATVIGMLHADRGPSEQLDVLDRDVLWEFAGVLSQIHESAALRRALRQQREALRRFVDQVTALSVSLADAPFSFSAYAPGSETARPAFAPVAPVAPTAGGPIPGGPIPGGDSLRDDRLVFSGLLTRRELDVLRLLADGGTNRTIADALVLSDTTVKFHVNSILRKLHVANRAEAVARYLSLLGLTSPQ